MPEFGSLAKEEMGGIRAAAAEAARDAARLAAEQVIENRKETERQELRRRPEELDR